MGRIIASRSLPLLLAALAFVSAGAQAPPASQGEGRFLSGVRQLTFEGRRAGEGYFSRDGHLLVFQSERQKDNPFYQIYLMDLEMGDVERVSPGYGKTTCSWIHPDGRHILFASTHGDPRSKELQAEEFALRASGKQRRYSWDYDEHFDLYEFDRSSRKYRQITSARGYDAEGSYSPDGKTILFASNRQAYETALSPEDQKRFEVDKALFMEIYRMNADGSGLKRLTHTRGYDGGPFYDATGKWVCWRRFSEDGLTAEIYTMDIEGEHQTRLTKIGAMSWAPYFHPSGEYLIFTTNRHGFGNFELYLVDRLGRGEPVRVTTTAGFDGLPAFSPDGKTLAWTTTRTPGGSAQIFIGNWNHAEALRLIEKARAQGGGAAEPELALAAKDLPNTQSKICEEDLSKHLKRLCAADMGGRLTGSPGEKLATSWVAANFKKFGLEPAAPGGGYLQSFEFTLPAGKEGESETSFHGRNVIGRLRAKNGSTLPALVIGAHVDHLGQGEYRGARKGVVYPGADDNASGVAALLEVAEYLSALQAKGRLGLQRDIIFAAWSGEELGLFGSKSYLKALSKQHRNPENLRSQISAYLNMDMVGRLGKQLTLGGLASSPAWARVIEQRNAPIGLPIAMDGDCSLSTDSTSFYLKGIPILSAFTGAHGDYHQPSDTEDKINYAGLNRISRFMALVARGLGRQKEALPFTAQATASKAKPRNNLRVWLGTIPNYAQARIPGLLLDGVAPDGPADKAGLRGDDIVVSLAGEKIKDIHDYAKVLDKLVVGTAVEVTIVRGEERLTFRLVPGSRK